MLSIDVKDSRAFILRAVFFDMRKSITLTLAKYV